MNRHHPENKTKNIEINAFSPKFSMCGNFVPESSQGSQKQTYQLIGFGFSMAVNHWNGPKSTKFTFFLFTWAWYLCSVDDTGRCAFLLFTPLLEHILATQLDEFIRQYKKMLKVFFSGYFIYYPNVCKPTYNEHGFGYSCVGFFILW